MITDLFGIMIADWLQKMITDFADFTDAGVLPACLTIALDYGYVWKKMITDFTDAGTGRAENFRQAFSLPKNVSIKKNIVLNKKIIVLNRYVVQWWLVIIYLNRLEACSIRVSPNVHISVSPCIRLRNNS